ncbi:sel1 repeat family protein [archaeon]|nr:MAG: sel1 repeat family protein [archaeon]
MSAKQNYIPALLKIAMYYCEGFGTDQNFDEMYNSYKCAADSGDSSAQYHLANVMKNKIAPNQPYNGEIMLQYLNLSADQEFRLSQCSLAKSYQTGDDGIRNYGEARRYLELAAELGYDAAQCHLGACYYHGWFDIPVNKVKARQLNEQAAAQGNAEAMQALSYSLISDHIHEHDRIHRTRRNALG